MLCCAALCCAAEANLGEVDVREAMQARADYLASIMDREGEPAGQLAQCAERASFFFVVRTVTNLVRASFSQQGILHCWLLLGWLAGWLAG